MQNIQTQLKHMPARVGPDMVRASELQSPAPAGHFLREFGQSDRDQIENANAETCREPGAFADERSDRKADH